MQIFNALAKCYNKNFEINFAHLPLFQSKEGKISKRVGGFSIMEMAKTGYEPEAILNALAKIGLSYYDDTFKQTPELIEEFTISSFNKAQIYFDFAIIESFNKKSLVNKTFAEVKNRLNSNINEHFFEKIKGNIIFLKEVEDWYEIFTNQSLNFINLLPENDIEFLAGILPSLEEKMQISWEEMQLILKKIAPERKGKQLFLPIRIALTGKEHGPEMKFLLEEIGVNTIKIRFTKK
jgi:glutamyl-tRNA synthetase